MALDWWRNPAVIKNGGMKMAAGDCGHAWKQTHSHRDVEKHHRRRRLGRGRFSLKNPQAEWASLSAAIDRATTKIPIENNFYRNKIKTMRLMRLDRLQRLQHIIC
jgi:hypothetical protein